jgi:hypothetical protein
VIRSAVLLAAVLVLAGCGSSSNATSSSHCEDAPLGTNNEVASSLETGFSADGFKAVRSRGDKDVWFVSARAVYPDGSAHYPTWATKNLGGGPVYIVDPVSRNVTPGLKKLQGVSASDEGATDARNCARKADGGS